MKRISILACPLLVLLTGGVAAGGVAEPEIDLDLLADHAAITPGGSAELAARFDIPGDWHIYWRNGGEGGLDTTLKWSVPNGYRVDSVRFPYPRRYVDTLDAHTFVLQGSPVILATLHAPTDVSPGDTVNVRLKADWLACQKVCFKQDRSVELELPVVADDDDRKPTHQEVFREARARVPLPATEAPHLDRFQVVASVDRVRPRAKFELAIVLDAPEDVRIGSHEPGMKSITPTDLFPDRTAGTYIPRPRFPDGQEATLESIGGEVSTYQARTVIILPVEADGELPGEQLSFSGVVTYQAVSGVPDAPASTSAVEWELTLPVASSEEVATAMHASLFAAGPTTGAQTESPATVPTTIDAASRNVVSRTAPTARGPAGFARGRNALSRLIQSDEPSTRPAGQADATTAPASDPSSSSPITGENVAKFDGPYLDQLVATASVNRAMPGERFHAAVVLDVQDGHHINAHEPLLEWLKATKVSVESATGLKVGQPVYPEGHRESSPLGDMAVYRGRVVIAMPVEALQGYKGDAVQITGKVTWQACTDDARGQCYAPETRDWVLQLPVAEDAEAVNATHTQLFEGLEPPTVVTSIVPEDLEPLGTAEPAVDREDGSADTAASEAPRTSESWLGRTQAWLAARGILGYLLMAFIGGFILNLMPCVLPVISIKVLSFVQQAKENRLRVLTLGVAFSAGIFVSFLVLGVLIVMLGQQWGGLFQRPQVVIILAAVVTAFAMSLFGVFSISPPRVVNELGDKVQGEGVLSSFGMGLLATVLGTACTAPFLALVITFASQQTAVLGLLIFIVAGLGMAFPYVVLAAKPVWLKFVPKPGPWMQTFEHVMGFLLLATVVWLFNTIAAQLGGDGALWSLLFLLFVALAAWAYGKVEFGAALGKKLVGYGSALALIVGGWVVCFEWMSTIPGLQARQREIQRALIEAENDWLRPPDWEGDSIPWVRYMPDRREKAVNAGYTVFIDYTAEWCINCKANERAILDTEPVRQAMERLGVLPFKADYTNYDPQIKAELYEYGGGSVPMYLVIPANQPDGVKKLDELLLSKSAVVDALEKAGPSDHVTPQGTEVARGANDE